jgi:hypothetical protein
MHLHPQRPDASWELCSACCVCICTCMYVCVYVCMCQYHAVSSTHRKNLPILCFHLAMHIHTHTYMQTDMYTHTCRCLSALCFHLAATARNETTQLSLCSPVSQKNSSSFSSKLIVSECSYMRWPSWYVLSLLAMSSGAGSANTPLGYRSSWSLKYMQQPRDGTSLTHLGFDFFVYPRPFLTNQPSIGRGHSCRGSEVGVLLAATRRRNSATVASLAEFCETMACGQCASDHGASLVVLYDGLFVCFEGLHSGEGIAAGLLLGPAPGNELAVRTEESRQGSELVHVLAMSMEERLSAWLADVSGKPRLRDESRDMRPLSKSWGGPAMSNDVRRCRRYVGS